MSLFSIKMESMYKEYRDVKKIDEYPEMWFKNLTSRKHLQSFIPDVFRFDNRMKIIKKYISKGGKISDMGCGAGDWVHRLNMNGFEASGVDFSEGLVRYCSEHLPKYKFYMADIRNVGFKDDELDGIVSWGVIEHDEAGIDAALNEFRRILKPGGVAIFTVPYDNCPARKMSNYQYPIKSGIFFQYYLNEGDIKIAAEASGFKLLEYGMSGPVAFAKISPSFYKRIGNNSFLLRFFLLVTNILYTSDKYKLMSYYVAKKL